MKKLKSALLFLAISFFPVCLWAKQGSRETARQVAATNDSLPLAQLTTTAVTVLNSDPSTLTATWTPLASSTDWNDPNNWLPDGIGVPDGNMTVIIPQSDSYPILTAPISVAEIHFEPGAQIGRQSYLSATTKAFVQYDLSKRERWNMLSIPLGEIFAGDFAFGGYPQVWGRYSFSSAINRTMTTGSWVNLYNVSVPLSFGDGFLLWLNSDTHPGEPVNDDLGLKLLEKDNKFRELPFFQHHDPNSPDHDFYTNIDQAHDYSSTDGISTFYSVEKDVNGQYVRSSIAYTVTRSESAYRLAGSDFKSKQLAFTNGNFALIGNPYMATLDYSMFYASNSNLIKPNYYIWTSTGYTIYTPEGNAGPTDYTSSSAAEQLIPPLQGFIVEKQKTADTSLQLSFSEDMTTVASKIALRSSMGIENKLNIIASTPVAGFNTFIAKRDGGQDEYGDLDACIISNSITGVPEIYTLKSYQGGLIAVGANIINNSDDLLIPVGLATSYAGNITLSFSGMDSYSADMSFIDAEANREIDLTGLASCDYVVNYTPAIVNGTVAACENRFFIRISKTLNGISEIVTGKVNVFESNDRHIQIVSDASNPIKEVEVYNLQGALVYKNSAIHAISYSVVRNLPVGVYIVKVISEKNTDNVKLIAR